MGADNWAICPRCLRRARKEHDERVAAVAALYGKVPVEEFDAERAALGDVDPEDFRTYREDYEFYGAESGEVTASYGGVCETCDLRLDFKHTHPLEDADD